MALAQGKHERKGSALVIWHKIRTEWARGWWIFWPHRFRPGGSTALDLCVRCGVGRIVHGYMEEW